MTIKEKARVAWEKDLEVLVVNESDEQRRGYIDSFSASELHIAYTMSDGGSSIEYVAITDIRFVGEVEEGQGEAVAIGQFAYTEPGAGRNVVGLICDSVLVNSVGKLAVHTNWLGGHHIAGMAGRLDMDFTESIFGYHGEAIVYEALICGEYADLTFTIDDPQESRQDEETEDQHDIAKERWEWRKDDDGITRLYHRESAIAYRGMATPEQISVMAAASELADKMRERINNSGQHSAYSDDVKNQIALLRKLGVPDVAPWYKEDE